MWKFDIPLPSSNNLVLGSTYELYENFDFPTNFQSFLNGVQLDNAFDITITTGLDYPSGGRSSTHHEKRFKQKNSTKPPGNFACSYTSPVISPSKSCYANPGTIPIKFTCSNLPSGTSLANFGKSTDGTTPWGPNIVVKEFGNIQAPPLPPIPNPLPSPRCDGTASTGGAPSKANADAAFGDHLGDNNLQPGGCDNAQLPSSGGPTATFHGGMWTYNWNVQSTSKGVVYEICTEDDSDGSWNILSLKQQEFCSAPFYVKNSCP